MSSARSIEQLQWRLCLSGIWIYILLNILFRDMHELFRSGFLEHALLGIVNGSHVTEENLLYGGIALQIPLLMTVLSRLLVDSLNRWLNLVASVFMFVGVLIFTTNPDMDDMLFALLELLALVVIFWFARRGPRLANPILN